jgi:hypothetical protein
MNKDTVSAEPTASRGGASTFGAPRVEAMEKYSYKSYQHYLDVQYTTNIDRKFITHLKFDLRAEDIQHMKSVYDGRRCLCVGCREDAEVDDFIENGFEARGIDILPTARQIQGDMNRLDKYFSPGAFDIAYSCHTLEHTYDPLKVLRMLRSICCEGVYLVLPIRDHPDEEEPVFLRVMQTRRVEDLDELRSSLGAYSIVDYWVRDDPTLPSGAEMAFALKWVTTATDRPT